MAVHIWNGSAWNTLGGVASTPVWVWNGSSWVPGNNSYVWNGSSWKGFIDMITLNPDYPAYASGNGNSALAEWGVYPSGYVAYTNSFGSTEQQYLWCQNSGNTGQYQISVSLSSGGPLESSSSPLDTWLTMSNAQFWKVFANEFNETVTANLVVSIRHAITQEVIVTEFISIAATTGLDFPLG